MKSLSLLNVHYLNYNYNIIKTTHEAKSRPACEFKKCINKYFYNEITALNSI